MSFIVTVKTGTETIKYHAIAKTSASLLDGAYDHFGACSVSIKKWRK